MKLYFLRPQAIGWLLASAPESRTLPSKLKSRPSIMTCRPIAFHSSITASAMPITYARCRRLLAGIGALPFHLLESGLNITLLLSRERENIFLHLSFLFSLMICVDFFFFKFTRGKREGRFICMICILSWTFLNFLVLFNMCKHILGQSVLLRCYVDLRNVVLAVWCHAFIKFFFFVCLSLFAAGWWCVRSNHANETSRRPVSIEFAGSLLLRDVYVTTSRFDGYTGGNDPWIVDVRLHCEAEPVTGKAVVHNGTWRLRLIDQAGLFVDQTTFNSSVAIAAGGGQVSINHRWVLDQCKVRHLALPWFITLFFIFNLVCSLLW